MYIPMIDLSLMFDSLPFLLSGLGYTLSISFSAFFLGNLLGVIIMLLNFVPLRSVKLFARFYLSFLRGTPALVLLFLLYFGLPYQLNAVVAAVICFSLTSSAFIGEIYRGSIAGINAGQRDAAYALGNRFIPTMRYIILPQALRISIPALSNVAMDLVKGSSLAAMITVPDIFQKAKIIGGRTFDYLSMYILVALIYWLLCIGIGHIQHRLEDFFQKKYQ